jgi:hypothetical protein
LYIRVSNSDGIKVPFKEKISLTEKKTKTKPSSRAKLLELSIRTATDFQDCKYNRDLRATDLKVDAILSSLKNETNLYHVREWKAFIEVLKRRNEPIST